MTESIDDDGYAEGQPRNLCCVCKEDLGPQNPRQLCRKSYCPMQSPYPSGDSDNSRHSFKQEIEAQVMCESCSLKSSQASSSSSSSSSSSRFSFSNTNNFKTSPISSQESPPCPPSQTLRVPTQDQPTQPVIETVQNVQTQKYPSNDIRFFLSSSSSSTKKQKVNG